MKVAKQLQKNEARKIKGDNVTRKSNIAIAKMNNWIVP